jgi:hypothetical protein
MLFDQPVRVPKRLDHGMTALLGSTDLLFPRLSSHVGDDAGRPDQLSFGFSVQVNVHSKTNGQQIVELTNATDLAGLTPMCAQKPSGLVPSFIKPSFLAVRLSKLLIGPLAQPGGSGGSGLSNVL